LGNTTRATNRISRNFIMIKIEKVVIVGGGSSGWMTASSLLKHFPDIDLTLIESSDIPTIGVGESTIGSINY